MNKTLIDKVKFDLYIDKAIMLLMEYGPKLILAIIVLIAGIMIINKLTKILKKLMEKREIDVSLKTFLASLINIVLKVLLVVSVADMVGIKTTSFVAIIGAAGLAVGLALQGTLANFAGGVLILIFKPYKVGDLIEAQGNKGRVKAIQIFVTILLTTDNKTIIIPNGAMSNGNITNYDTQGVIRVDLTVGISYNSNIKQAKEVLMNSMLNHQKVLKNPKPFVGVLELSANSVIMAVRPYCLPDDYWDVYFEIYEICKETLDDAKIKIPFPQLDVHINKD